MDIKQKYKDQIAELILRDENGVPLEVLSDLYNVAPNEFSFTVGSLSNNRRYQVMIAIDEEE